jgi:hypothetical protein
VSKLIYGPVRINITKVVKCSREAVTDDAGRYLYTRWTLHTHGIINPESTSYTFPGDQNMDAQAAANPAANFRPAPPLRKPQAQALQAQAGMPAPRTDRAIRHTLMSPRLKLTYLVGNEVLLDSPLTGYLSDCTNGPTPLHCDVVWVGATKTWAVEWVVRTDINEVVDAAGSGARAVLSCQWESEEEVDQDFLTTRTVKGVVTFRRDQLDVLLNGKRPIPDDFRKAFFFPVPPHTKREWIWTKQEAAGTRLLFAFRDREQWLDIEPQRQVTRIEAEQSTSLAVGGINAIKDVLANVGNLKLGDGLKAVLTMGGIEQYTLNVRVWGSRLADRQVLQSVAMGLYRKRFNPVALAFIGGALEWKTKLHQEYVELAAVHFAPPGVLARAFNNNNNDPGWLGDDDTPGFLTESGNNPPPAGDQLSRGTLLENLATTELSAAEFKAAANDNTARRLYLTLRP